MAEADFAAVRRNFAARAKLADSERVLGHAEPGGGRAEAIGIVAETE